MEENKQIYVPITLGVDSYKAELTEAAKATQASGAVIAQAASNASKANQSAAASTKTLQQEYRTAAKEAQKLAQIHGLNNAATLEAAQKAAQYKDALDDVNDRVNAFHPEKRWQLAGQAMSSLISITQGVVGSMQALGISSQTAEKAIVAMQALQGFAAALQNVEALKGAYVALSVAVKTSVIPSLMTMNGIIMASGIFALVAVVAAVAYHFYQQSKATEAAAKSLKDYNQAVAETSREQQDLAVQLLSGRDKAMAEITNTTTKKMLELYDKIKAIKDKAAEEDRALSNADLKRIESYNQQVHTINQIGEKQIADLKAQFRQEDIAKAKEYQDKQLKQAEQHEKDLVTWRAEAQERWKKMNETKEGFTIKVTPPKRENVDVFKPDERKNQVKNIYQFYEAMRGEIASQIQTTKSFAEQSGQILAQSLGSAFQGLGNAIGQSLASEGDMVDKVAAVFGNMLSTLANQLGAAMIALGTPMLFTPLAAKGALYIAGGVGLIAAGSFISSKMGGGSSGGGGTPSASSPSGGGSNSGWAGSGFGSSFGVMGSMNMQPALVSRVSGRDIQLVSGRQNIYSKRLTGK